jgi:hypothetical protein
LNQKLSGKPGAVQSNTIAIWRFAFRAVFDRALERRIAALDAVGAKSS